MPYITQEVIKVDDRHIHSVVRNGVGYETDEDDAIGEASHFHVLILANADITSTWATDKPGHTHAYDTVELIEADED